MELARANNLKQYDFIIVGGGVAGLSLAYQLVKSPLANCSILIIDQNPKNRNDRTLSFWSDKSTPFDEIIHHSWKQIRFLSDDFERKIELGNYSYKTLHGIDFYNFVEEELAQFPEVAFLQGRVEAIQQGVDGAFVQVAEQRYFGKWVFDSRLKPYEFKHEPGFGRQALRQYFMGWIVKTPQAEFDLSSATLFDFRVVQDGDMRFFYVLPYSEQEALIEYVGLKQANYGEIMKTYVEKVLKITEYEAEPLEGGAILLTDRRFKRKLGQRVMAIGSAAGMIKPSSGYAFTRIQHDTEAIINSLLEYGHPFKVKKVLPFYYMLDSFMLEAMSRFPGKMKRVFTGMFRHNSGDRVFRFLDERASVWEILALVISIPAKHLFIWTVFTDEKKKAQLEKVAGK